MRNLHYEKFPDGSVKCIEDEILFELPDGWAWSKIGPLCEYITSGSRGWAQYYSESGSLFLRMGNLSRDSFDLRLDSLQRVNLPDNAEGTRTRVAENDLLFSITAEIGMLGLIPANFEEAYIKTLECLSCKFGWSGADGTQCCGDRRKFFVIGKV